MEKIHSKQKILKFLLSHKKEEFTIRAISKEVLIDYKTAYLTVQQLVKRGVLKSKKAGQATLCSINQKEFNSDIFKAEVLRKQELLKNKDFHVLHKRISEDLRKPFFILLLFGSYASGEQRKGSDIDLMLITDDKSINKKTKSIISLTPLDIHLVDFTLEEFLSMLKTTEFSAGKEALNNNIILFGIENYYWLLKRAG